MKHEEILEYNRRCAEFLNWKQCLTHEFDKYGYCQTVDGFITPFKNTIANEQLMSYNQTDYEHTIGHLQFHSDWNWIMEVVEAIEKSKYEVHIFAHYNWIEPNRCVIQNWENMEIVHIANDSKKEAVVQAINQFLIWYKENK